MTRLLDYLESTGDLDDDLVILTGDQGFLLGEHDFMAERWMYEEAMRTPLVVRYPKLVEAGSTSGWRNVTYDRCWMHIAHDLRVTAHFGIRSERCKRIFFYGCDRRGQERTSAAWGSCDLQEEPRDPGDPRRTHESDTQLPAGRDLKRRDGPEQSIQGNT